LRDPAAAFEKTKEAIRFIVENPGQFADIVVGQGLNYVNEVRAASILLEAGLISGDVGAQERAGQRLGELVGAPIASFLLTAGVGTALKGLQIGGRIIRIVDTVRRGPDVGAPNGPDVPDTVVRQDNDFSSPVNDRGNPKPRLDENGNLIPANPNGTGSIRDQVRGANPDRSPFNSTTDPTQPGANPRQFGTSEVTIDTRRLMAEIEAGTVRDVEIVPPAQVREVLEGLIGDAQRRFNANPNDRNAERLRRAQDDLTNATTDGECLIRGCVPSRFISPIRPATPRPVRVTPTTPRTVPQPPVSPPANPSVTTPAVIGGTVAVPVILNNAGTTPPPPPAPPPTEERGK
jgi:hypothetical protein